jgi:class 3 adenylate cyclase
MRGRAAASDVKIAACVENLAEPGGFNFSRAVRGGVRDRLPIVFREIGVHDLANVARLVRVFRIVAERRARAAGAKERLAARRKRPISAPACAALPNRARNTGRTS